MTSETEDALDKYIKPVRPNRALTKEHVEENSGHRMLCYKCNKFQRSAMTFVEGGSLRVQCKVCNTFSDFVIRKEGFVPKGFSGLIQAFAKKRTRETLGRKN